MIGRRGALLIGLWLAGSPAVGLAQSNRLKIPWELLEERRRGAHSSWTVRVEKAGGLVVEGHPNWQEMGLASLLTIEQVRVRATRQGAVARMHTPCEPGEPLTDTVASCTVRVEFTGFDPAAAARALDELSLAPDEDPVRYTAPFASAILGRRLGAGLLGLDPLLQSEILWTFRPVDDRPRIDWPANRRRPTVRIDVGLLGILSARPECQISRLAAEQLYEPLGTLGEALLTARRHLDVEILGVFSVGEGGGEIGPEPPDLFRGPFGPLDVLGRGLGALFVPFSERVELSLHARSKLLTAVADGNAGTGDFVARLKATLGGRYLDLPPGC